MLDSTANDDDDPEVEDDNEDDSDFHSQSDSDSDGSEKAGRLKKEEATQKKPRRRPVKTAREYWQRELEEEAEREAEQEEKKRKCEDEAEGSNKAQKTAAGSPQKQTAKHSAARASMLHSLSSVDKSIKDGDVPTMGAIQARTHADQMKQIMKGIPEGYDTRRTRSQAKDVEQAKSSFGYRKVEALDGRWKLKGMNTGLMNQQIVASAWMVKREAQELHPAGGLLADDMGLGKTITTLACIVGHPPEKEDRDEFSRATLVVVGGPQDAQQWADQTERHCDEKFFAKTTIYSKKIPWRAAQWGRRHIELVAQFPNKNVIQALRGQWAGDPVGFERALQENLGQLFKINWYRVVLDEAHSIKNRTSSTTLACWQLSAKFRWIVSGTPISNTFYPYLRFLGCSFAVNLKKFKSEYMDGGHSNGNFEALVSLVMYRRKQDETFLGRRIVSLPESHSHDLWVPLEDWEMAMMRALDNQYEKDEKKEKKNKEQPAAENNDEEQEDEDEPENTDQAHGTADEDEDDEADAQNDTRKPQSATAIRWKRFVRLRQAVSHPLNLEKFLRELDREEIIQMAMERLKEEAEAIQNDADKAEAHAEQLAQDKAGREMFSAGAHQIKTLYKDWFGGAEEMAQLRALAANEQEVKEVTCGLCKKATPPVEPTRGAYCITVGVSKARGSVKFGFKCPIPDCSASLAVGETLKTPACIQADVDRAKALKVWQEPGKDSIGTKWGGDRDGRASFFLATSERDDIDYGPVNLPLGSKVKATMEVILTWVKEAPKDKIIGKSFGWTLYHWSLTICLVFVEFTRTAKALGCILEKMGLNFLYYNRTANAKQKDKALREFRNNPEQTIFLASMKCGGQALDLPVANRVIIVDLWYNKTVEQQAFKRVHRIGQKKETHLVRILARGSIDERLYKLQNAKETIINRALQDDGHFIDFSEGQSLRWLFSDETEEDLIQEMDAMAQGLKDKAEEEKKA
ncbi:uncharacterized protein NECHADRAFT_46398 [Fusarium vanettenii 77-13-4]|uniref:Helicase C-terminal domain-containing protein n=1 Tax=Fusarium vanettenii (strain ATCC MYA-4622 / CBS 123669 / FGSC 9596 / NRRL 45880 / 77-13-4) TaxID=660122 RepID=C7Z485_FUSV7|nr:uncharacterized protein NECHADRAFT_46398 [Fusarium vanettenii 77-13-4]EEU41438.1 hypothetical protein NECHADRAFT_46398 [Fusarium vanettenii 77-13-4]